MGSGRGRKTYFFPVLLCFIYHMTQISAASPVARHMAITVTKNTEIVIPLLGFDADGDALTAEITELPASGSLYQLSSVFNLHGYEPKMGTKVTSTGVVVSGKKMRIIYNPPTNTNPSTTGVWAQFKYTVNDGTSTSNQGIVSLVSSDHVLVGSKFDTSNEGWSVVNNAGITTTTHEPSSRGALNHYIWSRDNEINMNQATQTDKKAWYFQAPSKFLGNHAIAYGGSLDFWLSSASGDFSLDKRNTQEDLVELVCDSCASQTGIRLIRRLSAGTPFNGSPTHMSIPLLESGWLKDTKNTLVAPSPPTACEMAEVLEGLTSVRILGDFTKWYETISIDDVMLKHGPGVPIECYAVLS